jgi:hypothetical protein
MCCFSIASAPAGFSSWLFAPRVHVSKTNLFARMMSPGVQALAYGMHLSTKHEIAMILPLPVVPGSGEDAVKFVSLAKHPQMFSELQALFFVQMPAARKAGSMRSIARMPQRLVVHEVGAFIASYVPRRDDFTRLDERFRMPSALFDAVPHYRDYGFAVFQLKPGNKTIHPMAMTFPTRAPDKLFFPTVHVHDGKFHATAKFDHALYFQGKRATGDDYTPMRSHKDYEGLVATDAELARRTLRAKLPNEDVWIAT